ncbi:MAG: beta-N-acetylhexosaminidase [Prolixibacteraceae bacterium]
MHFRITIWLVMAVFLCQAQEIIPFPNQYGKTGGMLKIPGVVAVSASDEFAELIPLFIESAQKFDVQVKKKQKKGFIQLIRNRQLTEPEEYRLNIGSKMITVEAGHANGCFYGLQSALQLIKSAGTGGSIDCAVINDRPRYAWRGVMIDESRYFIGMDEVKTLLDLMAFQKLNKFHWHLTDVPGWRMEIKRYPLLATIGGKGNQSDPDAPVRYYTQAEIREIVAYAGKRFIEVIPEIDMPGHATSAVKAYPEFSGGGSEKYPDFTFNPGREGTYGFLTNILKEVKDLFPSRYIHIGGDEVHFGNEQWNYLPDIQNLIRDQGLTSLVEVERYFLSRMADSIQAMGKTVIGWDEVVAAGLSRGNTVAMWWRHDKTDLLKDALKKEYEVILSPRIPFYFDFVQHETHAQGRRWPEGIYVPIEAVYQFTDTALTMENPKWAEQIKGIQANMWTDRIHSVKGMQYMLYPRLSALAETAWTREEQKNQKGFFSRMEQMMAVYKNKGLYFFDYRDPGSTPEVE